MKEKPQKTKKSQMFAPLQPNEYYTLMSPPIKITMNVLEQGLEYDKKGKLRYNESKGKSWLSRMSRELEGEISRATIDEYLDSLLDERYLRHGEQEMQKVDDDGTTKWVRAYYVGNEFVPKILTFYIETHDIPGMKKTVTSK